MGNVRACSGPEGGQQGLAVSTIPAPDQPRPSCVRPEAATTCSLLYKHLPLSSLHIHQKVKGDHSLINLVKPKIQSALTCPRNSLTEAVSSESQSSCVDLSSIQISPRADCRLNRGSTCRLSPTSMLPFLE